MELVEKLKNFFALRPDIAMAFLFGSHAKGNPISESDVDVAVYFVPEGRDLEWETDRDYGEDALWLDVENVVNASIDIARILLASEKQPLPETYAAVLLSLEKFPDCPKGTARTLAEFSKLRNILAHEYLDLRFQKISRFVEESPRVYGGLVLFVRNSRVLES